MKKDYKIAVAGTGYVGLSIATLLSQHHQVTAVDIIPEKVDMINNRKSPIQDDYIEKYLAEKELNLTATLDAKAASDETDMGLNMIKRVSLNDDVDTWSDAILEMSKIKVPEAEERKRNIEKSISESLSKV